MLVLDEQLLGRNLEAALGRWYRGPVRFITDLHPGTVIKDDAIPVLLRQQQHATFLTINEVDFWRKVVIDGHFCIVCFVLPDSRAREIPELSCAVFRLLAFRTRRAGWGRCCGWRTGRSATTRIESGKYEWCHCGCRQPKPCGPTLMRVVTPLRGRATARNFTQLTALICSHTGSCSFCSRRARSGARLMPEPCVPGMSSCLGVRVPCPGGRGAEGPGKRQGVAARRGLKAAWSEGAGRGTRTCYEGWPSRDERARHRKGFHPPWGGLEPSGAYAQKVRRRPPEERRGGLAPDGGRRNLP
jgi:hypothetical protein